ELHRSGGAYDIAVREGAAFEQYADDGLREHDESERRRHGDQRGHAQRGGGGSAERTGFTRSELRGKHGEDDGGDRRRKKLRRKTPDSGRVLHRRVFAGGER